MPITGFESGAVLLYLADKAQRLIPATGAARYQVGQLGYFKKYAPEKVPAAIERYMKETQRRFGVLDRHLATVPYLATTYSVADLMNVTWVHAGEGLGVAIEDSEHLRRWHDDVMARPGVQRGYALQPT